MMPYSQAMALTRVVAGVAAAGLGAVGVGYAGLAGQDDSTRDESGQIVDGGEVGAFRIRLGDCYNELTPDADEVESVDGVPCAGPHDTEIYFAFNLPGDEFPGADNVQESAGERCFEEFETFVGRDYETSAYGFYSMYPSEASWDGLDDREVLCAIYNYDKTKKTGSARNTGL